MKAFIVDRYGSKDCTPDEMPDPELREDETRQRAVSFPQFFNPQPNPQCDTSYMTCAEFGSPKRDVPRTWNTILEQLLQHFTNELASTN